MGRERQLLESLSDGRFHSGEELAIVLGVSRAAVWKVVRLLGQRGLEIQAVRGRGYRLPEPVEFLERERILAGLDPEARRLIHQVDVHTELDSTNTYLMAQAKCGLPGGAACLAERQLAGRGRRGRTWVSPYAANLYLSLLWRFNQDSGLSGALSLAVGVAVMRALQAEGLTGTGLKWPNDLLWRGQKLGGILLEFGGESSGPSYVVAGVGLNVSMPRSARTAIDQPWADLRGVLGRPVSRNALAARVLGEMGLILARYERGDWLDIKTEWRSYDLTLGRAVTLKLPHTTVAGVARGVDDSGALLLETHTGLHRYTAGEVSLRFSP